jgi:uncharacterized protein with FMN-binding domain
MKKAIIGLLVVGTLVIYSLAIRHERPQLSAPQSLTSTGSTNNNSATTSGSGMPPSNSMSNNTSMGPNSSSGQYKDGNYTGSVADAYYGNVQVKASISGGKIADVSFLQYPDTHSESVYINQQAMPYLKQEAIKSQNANVDIISGATFTSQAFIQSLTSALSQAS